TALRAGCPGVLWWGGSGSLVEGDYARGREGEEHRARVDGGVVGEVVGVLGEPEGPGQGLSPVGHEVGPLVVEERGLLVARAEQIDGGEGAEERHMGECESGDCSGRARAVSDQV